MSNIILKNTTSSIFLAFVLIVATFAAIYPSSFITGVNADQCGEDVKACFQQFLSKTQFEQLSEALDSRIGVKVDILGSNIPEVLKIYVQHLNLSPHHLKNLMRLYRYSS